MPTSSKQSFFAKKPGYKVVSLMAALPLAFGIVGCTGSDQGKKAEEKPVASSSASADDKNKESAEKSKDETSKDDVKAGVVKLFKETPDLANNLDDKQIDNIANCFANDVDGKISNATKQKIASGEDVAKGDPDYEVVFKSIGTCTEDEVKKAAPKDNGNAQGEKVSDEQLKAGMLQLVKKQPKAASALTDEQMDQIGNCFVEKAGPKLTPETKQRLAKGQDVAPGASDQQTVFEFAKLCTQEVVQKKG